MRVQGRWTRMLLIAPMYFMAMIVVHESGHAYAITKTGLAGARILIWPGYELYPNIGADYSAQWPGKSFAFTQPAPTSEIRSFTTSSRISRQTVFINYEELREHQNFITLMGVVATTTASILSLVFITLFRPGGVFLWALGAGALMHVDALTYTIFPIFLEAPHFYFFGGSVSEPIVALTNLGLSQPLSVGMVLALSLAQFVWLYCLLNRGKVPLPKRT